MSDTVRDSLLKRRVTPPRPVMATGATAIKNMLVVALPRTADQLMGLQVSIQSVIFGILDQSAVIANLTENDLICRMSRAGSSSGLIVVDPPFLAALIEFQTLGKVTSVPPTERPPTNTDVTVLSDILDHWLTDLARAASEHGLAEDLLPTGYTRDAGHLDLRAAELALDPGQFRLLDISIDFGGETKFGKLSIYTPIVAASKGENLDATFGHQLRTHLLDAPVEMTAVLARESRSLDEITSLNEGDMFLLRTAQLQSVRLEAEDGNLISMARLGQTGGKRAVRPSVNEKPNQSLLGIAAHDSEITAQHKPDDSGSAAPQIKASLADSGDSLPSAETEDKSASDELHELSDPESAVACDINGLDHSQLKQTD